MIMLFSFLPLIMRLFIIMYSDKYQFLLIFFGKNQRNYKYSCIVIFQSFFTKPVASKEKLMYN